MQRSSTEVKVIFKTLSSKRCAHKQTREDDFGYVLSKNGNVDWNKASRLPLWLPPLVGVAGDHVVVQLINLNLVFQASRNDSCRVKAGYATHHNSRAVVLDLMMSCEKHFIQPFIPPIYGSKLTFTAYHNTHCKIGSGTPQQNSFTGNMKKMQSSFFHFCNKCRLIVIVCLDAIIGKSLCLPIIFHAFNFLYC